MTAEIDKAANKRGSGYTLTPARMRVLEAIRKHEESCPYWGPTFDEIATTLDMTRQGVQYHVEQLEQSGFVKRSKFVARSLRSVSRDTAGKGQVDSVHNRH